MNSMAVGMAFEAMMSGTVPMACASVGYGIRRLTFLRGSGNSFRMAFVTMPSVPSEPMNMCLRSGPDECDGTGAECSTEQWISASLGLAGVGINGLKLFRRKFPVLADADAFELK